MSAAAKAKNGPLKFSFKLGASAIKSEHTGGGGGGGGGRSGGGGGGGGGGGAAAAARVKAIRTNMATPAARSGGAARPGGARDAILKQIIDGGALHGLPCHLNFSRRVNPKP
jgi:hypothetical protein